MFLDITIEKDFIMVTVLSEEDFKNIDMSEGKGGLSKYPWYTTEVDQGFYVPLSDMKKTDNRPTCPSSLTKEGWKFITRKTLVGGVKSIAVQRIV
mgnify:FL=1